MFGQSGWAKTGGRPVDRRDTVSRPAGGVSHCGTATTFFPRGSAIVAAPIHCLLINSNGCPCCAEGPSKGPRMNMPSTTRNSTRDVGSCEPGRQKRFDGLEELPNGVAPSPSSGGMGPHSVSSSRTSVSGWRSSVPAGPSTRVSVPGRFSATTTPPDPQQRTREHPAGWDWGSGHIAATFCVMKSLSVQLTLRRDALHTQTQGTWRPNEALRFSQDFWRGRASERASETFGLRPQPGRSRLIKSSGRRSMVSRLLVLGKARGPAQREHAGGHWNEDIPFRLPWPPVLSVESQRHGTRLNAG